MNDSDDAAEKVWPYLEPFLRAAEHYALTDGEGTGWFAPIEEHINAEPITEDDHQLSRAWGLISVASVVLGATLRESRGETDTSLSDDDYWCIRPVDERGTSVSLDEVLPPESVAAVRLMIAGANNDFDAGFALVAATWEQHGPPGILLVLESLVSLYVALVDPEEVRP